MTRPSHLARDDHRDPGGDELLQGVEKSLRIALPRPNDDPPPRGLSIAKRLIYMHTPPGSHLTPDLQRGGTARVDRPACSRTGVLRCQIRD